MSNYIVHTVPGSPCARAVLVTLIEKGVSFRVAGMAPGMQKIEPHLSRNPFAPPSLCLNWTAGFSMRRRRFFATSTARIRLPALTPADPKAAARMDQIMGISDWYLFQGVNSVIGFQRIVGPRLFGLSADERAIEKALPQARTVFKELSALMGDKLYLVSNDLTLADLIVAPHMDFLAQTPEWAMLTAHHANLLAWHERVAARHSFEATTWERVSQMTQAGLSL